MELADAKVIKTGHNNYSVSYGDDSANHVEFEQVAIQNASKSAEAGCPQFDNIDFIKIMFPGDKTKIVHKKATQQYIERYPRQWEAYKEQRKQVPNGFPLEQWPILTKAEAMNLKSMHIHTVEQLAHMPDSGLTFLGAMSYREKAQATLAKAVDASAITAMKAENEALKVDLAALKEQIKELATINKKEKDRK